MIYNIIAGGIIAVAFIALAIIFIKKLPKMRTIDTETIAEEKQAQVKDRILMERLQRKSEKSKDKIKKVFVPVGNIFKNIFKKLYKKVVDIEKKYKLEAGRKPLEKGGAFEEQLKSLLAEALENQKQEKYQEAEKKFIEAISLDPKFKKSYQGLANLYIAQKEYEQALQTATHVMKLDLKKSKEIIKLDSKGNKYKSFSNSEDLTEDYIKIAEICQELKDLNKAFDNLKKALEYTPHDPKTLDLLIENSLLRKDKAVAINYFNKLNEINPDNQKLLEYRKKLEEI